MLKSYFTTSLRALLRNKEYTVINALGLSVSIASCLILFFVVRYETSIDAFHHNADGVYRVVTNSVYPEGTINTPGTPEIGSAHV